MGTETERQYWDSCLFIDTFKKFPGHIEVLEKIISLAENNQLHIVTSTLAIAECCKIRRETPLTEVEIQQINDFMERDIFEIVQVDRGIAIRAAEIVRNYGLKPPDAIHIATALIMEVSVFFTYEHQMLGKDGKIYFDDKSKTGIPLKIKEPFIPIPDEPKKGDSDLKTDREKQDSFGFAKDSEGSDGEVNLSPSEQEPKTT